MGNTQEKIGIQLSREGRVVVFGLIISLLIITTLTNSCSQSGVECKSLDYPKIEVVFNNDTIILGEVFEARIFMSDTSLYTFYDSERSKYVRVHPYFKINDSLIYTKSDTLIHSVVLNEIPENRYLPGFYEWTCSIIVPHPIEFEGDIEFKKRFDNYIFKSE